MKKSPCVCNVAGLEWNLELKVKKDNHTCIYKVDELSPVLSDTSVKRL